MQTAKPEPLYYDIGLNLFCRQFPDPDAVMDRAAGAGVLDPSIREKLQDFREGILRVPHAN
jgi:hypothetical protein